jgi:hypothetical protein
MTNQRSTNPHKPETRNGRLEAVSLFGAGSRNPSGPAANKPRKTGRTHDRSRSVRQIKQNNPCIEGAVHTWDDVIFYRPNKSARYAHIDPLFSRGVDWRLIATHWQDLMQVVLSIQAGLVLPSMLLRKLGSHNRKSKLNLAFRELGRVERTLFLLGYISDPQIRRTIRAETTKIESFNDFLDWITFGGPVIKSGDPVEQEKQLKYASLVANAIMLSNVANLSQVISNMAADGAKVTPELVAPTSPYIRKHIRRFGKYDLDMDDLPDPLNPVPLPFEIPSPHPASGAGYA